MEAWAIGQYKRQWNSCLFNWAKEIWDWAIGHILDGRSPISHLHTLLEGGQKTDNAEKMNVDCGKAYEACKK